MLYDTVCHANLQSVIRYPYLICIRGIVENDIRIYLYPQKFKDICKYIYPRSHIRHYAHTSAYRCNFEWPWTSWSDLQNF